MRYLSICSGIEAATQAWHPLGWTCAGVSEIEPFPRAVLEQRIGAQPVDWDHRYEEGSNVTPLFGDFTKIEEHHVGPVDLLVGGTPCQSFSIAGLRDGLADPRGNLTLEFFALAQRVRPRWIVWENVPGVLSHDEGRTMGTILALMGECGFRWAYRVLDAQYVRTCEFEGAVPQQRRRVFVVGYSGAGRVHPRAVLFDPESLSGNPAPRRAAGQIAFNARTVDGSARAGGNSRPEGAAVVAGEVAPTIPSRSKSGGGLGTDFDCDGGLIVDQPTAEGQKWPADVAPTLNAAFGSKLGLEDQHIRGGGEAFSSPHQPEVAMCLNAGAMGRRDAETETLIPTRGGGFDEADVAHSLRAEGFDASEDGTGRGTPLVPVQQPFVLMERGRDDGAAYTLESRQVPQAIAFSAKDHGGDALEEASPKRRAGSHFGSHQNGGVMPAVAFAQNQRDEVRTMEVSGALAADPGMKQTTYVAAEWRVRRLTPRECERLMGFPDDFTRIEWRGKPAENCPDGPRYKVLGNSMAVNCKVWIGERIEAVEALAE